MKRTEYPPKYPLEQLGSDGAPLSAITDEIADGFAKLSKIPPSVAILGSARASRDNPCCAAAAEIARKAAMAGYGVISGGGPGIMEAANRGAVEGGGLSTGLHIHLPAEQICNEYVNLRTDSHYFFVRKLLFARYAAAYVVMPGGMGTLDELSDAFVLLQTEQLRPFPIILFDSSFWNGLLEWMRTGMVRQGYIREEELDLVRVMDDPDAVIAHIQNYRRSV